MPQLGFTISAWTGHEDGHDGALRIVCGSYSTVPNVPGNSVVLELPREEPEQTQTCHPDVLSRLLVATVASFEPATAVVIPPGEAMSSFRGKPMRPLGPRTYFAIDAGQLSAILPEASVAPLGRGAIVVTEEDAAWRQRAAGRLGEQGITI